MVGRLELVIQVVTDLIHGENALLELPIVPHLHLQLLVGSTHLLAQLLTLLDFPHSESKAHVCGNGQQDGQAVELPDTADADAIG